MFPVEILIDKVVNTRRGPNRVWEWVGHIFQKPRNNLLGDTGKHKYSGILMILIITGVSVDYSAVGRAEHWVGSPCGVTVMSPKSLVSWLSNLPRERKNLDYWTCMR